MRSPSKRRLKGDDGANGVAGWERKTNSLLVGNGPNEVFFADATCSSGKRPLGGGYQLKDEVGGPAASSSVRPRTRSSRACRWTTGWRVAVQQDEDFTLIVWAICANVSP
jgi:hypothetical protein